MEKKNGKYTINWQDKAEKINNKIRIHSVPYNPAESSLFNRYIFINKATPNYDKKYISQGCGKIVDIIDCYLRALKEHVINKRSTLSNLLSIDEVFSCFQLKF